MKRFTLAMGFVVLASSCAQNVDKNVALRTAMDDHVFKLRARGDIVSSESITINVPNAASMRMNIEWLLPEYTRVAKGDLVARFDRADMEWQRDAALVQIANQNLEIQKHAMASEMAQAGIEHQSVRVDGETTIARTFAGFDPRYFSRNEIIDAIGDLNYLGVEAAYYDWQANTHDQRTKAQTAHIQAQRFGSEQQLSRQESAIEASEIRSPADGIFIYSESPWGEKMRRGMTVFPGNAVGKLPIDGKVEVRIYVPATDAVGIEPSQIVKYRLDTKVEREFRGVVKTVAPMASARARNDPRRFVIVTATIDERDNEELRIGSALSAIIVTAELKQAIVLPQQAVFMDDAKALVHVIDGVGFDSREVTLGRRSPTLVEVVAGLKEGEWVSLVEPEVIDT